jgi:uncharacterized protein (DUF58 family)
MNTGNNLLYMILSLLLAFLVLSGVLSESALRGLEIRRRLPREIFAQSPAPMAIEVRNHQRRIPSFAIVVEDLVGPELEDSQTAGRVFVFRVGPGQSESRSYTLWVEHRGELPFAGFRASTRFPFGLFSKSMRVEARTTALVYPAVVPLSSGPALAGGAEGSAASDARGENAVVAGLREYVPGDPFRRIHWRASLRGGQLLVRERERDGRREHEVRLRTRDVESGPGFERAVQRAASETVAHLGAGAIVALRTDATRVPFGDGPSHRRRLLDLLARVVPDQPRGVSS